MNCRFDPTPRTYTGEELRPHFLLQEMGIQGSGLGAFIGPCDVPTEHLVDWEDRLANDSIRSQKMVHFIGEFFGWSLRETVVFQRLLIATLKDSLHELKPELTLIREGDDLFFKSDSERMKLSVSISTASPVSTLIHTGINIDPTGAPVAAAGLDQLGIEPEPWVEGILQRVQSEYNGIEWACAKVRPVM